MTTREVQQLLNNWGFGPLVVDGIVGPKTTAAIRTFQASRGLVVDGIVGPKTAEALHYIPTRPTDDQLERQRSQLKMRLFQRAADKYLHSNEPTNGDVFRVLKCAIADIGKAEHPNGSNSGREIGHLVGGYGKYWQIPGYKPAAWCGMACSQWIRRGLQAKDWPDTPMEHWLGGVYYDGLGSWHHWARKNGTLRDEPAPGAVFLMGRGGSGSDEHEALPAAGHCGLVLWQNGPAADTVVTVEGNVGNRVASRRRKLDTIDSYVWWWDG